MTKSVSWLCLKNHTACKMALFHNLKLHENVYCFSQIYKHKCTWVRQLFNHASYLLSACKTLLFARVLFAEWVAKLLAAAGYLI